MGLAKKPAAFDAAPAPPAALDPSALATELAAQAPAAVLAPRALAKKPAAADAAPVPAVALAHPALAKKPAAAGTPAGPAAVAAPSALARRPAASDAATPAPVVKSRPAAEKEEISVEDQVADACDAVVQQGVPARMRKKLGASLSVPRAQRQPWQEEMVGIIRTALTERHAALRKAILDQEASAAEAESRAASIGEATLSAGQELDRVRRAEATSRAEILSGQQKLSQTQEALQLAQAKQQQARKRQKSAGAELSSATRIYKSVFTPLMDGSCATVHASIKQLTKFATERGIDPMLVSNFEPSLRRPPGERGDFDKLLLRHMSEELEKLEAEVRITTEASEKAGAEAAAAAAAAKEASAALRARLKESRARMSERKRRRLSAESAQASARKAYRKCEEERKSLVSSMEEAKVRLAQFESGALTTFLQLS